MDFSKMDFKKIIDINEIKKSLSRLENVSALSLVVFFFFPWASFGPFSVNGFGAAASGQGLSFLLFLVPLLGLIVVAMRPICQTAAILKVLKLVTGALPIVGFVLALIDAGGQLFNVIGLGVYLTLIASVLIILGTLDKVQLPNALPAVPASDEEAPSEEA